MAKEKKTFNFAPLPVPTTTPMPEEASNSTVATVLPTVSLVIDEPPSGITKVTFDCDNALLEKMKDYGYWEGLTQKDIIIESLDLYFQDKAIRPRPERIKQRPKVGRKPKK